MDDYILRILKVNAEAKSDIETCVVSHADEEEKLKATKKEIDQEIAQRLIEKTAATEAASVAFMNELQPKYDQQYEERVEDLMKRFASASEEWYQTLFERITTIDGQ